MKKLELNYVVYFHDITQTPREIYETNAATARELILELDKIYPGIAKELMAEDGSARPQSAMILNRAGQRAGAVKDFSKTIEDGDQITFL